MEETKSEIDADRRSIVCLSITVAFKGPFAAALKNTTITVVTAIVPRRQESSVVDLWSRLEWWWVAIGFSE